MITKVVLVYHRNSEGVWSATVFRVACLNLNPYMRYAEFLYTGQIGMALAYARGSGMAGAIVRSAYYSRSYMVDLKDQQWEELTNKVLDDQPLFRDVRINGKWPATDMYALINEGEPNVTACERHQEAKG